MNATIDLIGTTYSTRFSVVSIESSTAIDASEPLCTLDKVDELYASNLPAMKALMDAGATFSVHRGCPMLRVHDVPPAEQRWLEPLSVEFGSATMSVVVRGALQDCADQPDMSPELADNIAAAQCEWDDAPQCAIVMPPIVEASQTWTATTKMPFDFLPISEEQCSFKCGKRLNRAVAAMLHHVGLGVGSGCMTLFTGPEDASIVLAKLRGYTERYRDLFSRATNWFAADVSGSFCARERGLFVFGTSAENVQRALLIADAVVQQQLAPALAWRFECERDELAPLTREQVMISASCVAGLERLIIQEGRNVRAVSLAFGRAQDESDRVLQLLLPLVEQLRVLTVAGWSKMPATFFERLMDANRALVVGWYATSSPLVVPLARKYADRFCVFSTATDAGVAKSKLAAMNFDEEMARTLVGTLLATKKLRNSTLRRMVSVPLPHSYD
jgi:hypothetical protein